jgi:hypothetical protein
MEARISDIRKVPSIAIQQAVGLTFPNLLKVDINECGDLAKSHAAFTECLSKALEKAVIYKWITESERSVIEEAGIKSSIGTFGPAVGSGSKYSSMLFAYQLRQFEFCALQRCG